MLNLPCSGDHLGFQIYTDKHNFMRLSNKYSSRDWHLFEKEIFIFQCGPNIKICPAEVGFLTNIKFCIGLQ